MLAKYFTGSIHICFLTSQKGVGFIEESELLCPCHEHLETSNVSAQVVGGSGVNDRINLDPPEGLSLDPPDAEILQRTRLATVTLWLLDLSRLQSQRESVETCAGWLLYCRKLRATQPPDFSPSNAAMPAIWAADIAQKKK